MYFWTLFLASLSIHQLTSAEPASWQLANSGFQSCTVDNGFVPNGDTIAATCNTRDSAMQGMIKKEITPDSVSLTITFAEPPPGKHSRVWNVTVKQGAEMSNLFSILTLGDYTSADLKERVIASESPYVAQATGYTGKINSIKLESFTVQKSTSFYQDAKATQISPKSSLHPYENALICLRQADLFTKISGSDFQSRQFRNGNLAQVITSEPNPYHLAVGIYVFKPSGVDFYPGIDKSAKRSGGAVLKFSEDGNYRDQLMALDPNEIKIHPQPGRAQAPEAKPVISDLVEVKYTDALMQLLTDKLKNADHKLAASPSRKSDLAMAKELRACAKLLKNENQALSIKLSNQAAAWESKSAEDERKGASGQSGQTGQ